MTFTQISFNKLVYSYKEDNSPFGTNWKLPIIADFYSECRKRYKGGKVLDVGAGVSMYLKSALKINTDKYYSLDNDASGSFTYSSFSDIPKNEKFQFITANQVLEHLSIDDAVGFMKQIVTFLEPGGIVAITVPNILHPIRFQTTATHVSAWSFEELYGLLKDSGLKVEQISRYGKYRLTRNPIKRIIIRIVSQAYTMDWCDSIMIIGRK